ncbi:hypothetical protein ACFPMF_17615 [Larkinella bovis]|uniref:Uncharacterized protein n=1 Tax=Larkinella bovis TaxID=683041 RepID=A0ABW0ICZ7_9BACT
MTDNSKDHYRGDAGNFIRNRDAEKLTRRFRQSREGKKGEFESKFTRAEFFGINRLNELLGYDDCVGIRIYYGLGEEKDDNGELRPKLVLAAVNSKGKDIFFGNLTSDAGLKTRSTEEGDEAAGMKDMPVGRDALADGMPCPHSC